MSLIGTSASFPHDFNRKLLEVIIHYGSAFVAYRNEIESKGVRFSGQDASNKISRGSQFAVARKNSKISALVPQEHQIRMRCEERNYENKEILNLILRFVR